jgi:hypothetical protein
VVLALTLNFAIKLVAQALDPSLARMAQLQGPLVILTVEGAFAAIVVFAIVAWLVPRPIFWYRIVGVIALLVSLIPDVALAMGGAARTAAMRVVGPLMALGELGTPGPGPGGPPRGGPPGGGFPPGGGLSGMPLEQVFVLMLLHVATAAVCIVVLTTLTRTPVRVRGRDGAEA